MKTGKQQKKTKETKVIALMPKRAIKSLCSLRALLLRESTHDRGMPNVCGFW